VIVSGRAVLMRIRKWRTWPGAPMPAC